MRASPLKTAVLGLDEAGRLLLEATRGLDCFSITAVADNDTKLAQQIGTLWNCAAYDDYRQLIIANQLDCLLVTAPLYSCAEYLRMAIKKKFNIFQLPPLARNFSEAAEFVKLARDEAITLAVANLDRFAKPALAMKTHLLQNPSERPFFILAAEGPVPEQPQTKWRSDPVLAGGGAILYDCWEIIDQIILNFGVPQQVYCPALSTVAGVAGNTSPDGRQRLYLTEDNAIVTMKFSDTLSGNLLAGRAAGKGPQKWLVAHTQNTVLKFDDKSFEVTDSQDQRLCRDESCDDRLGKMKMSLENFGSSLLAPDQNALVSAAADNLKNMAVIEAAYLSARTGMPEQPGKILKMA
ncbi:MAG: Gfo/Idh/MocA family oxidoreductase [Sedimentisphaerales bacterium]|jgi:predicted dehydrogenase